MKLRHTLLIVFMLALIIAASCRKHAAIKTTGGNNDSAMLDSTVITQPPFTDTDTVVVMPADPRDSVVGMYKGHFHFETWYGPVNNPTTSVTDSDGYIFTVYKTDSIHLSIDDFAAFDPFTWLYNANNSIVGHESGISLGGSFNAVHDSLFLYESIYQGGFQEGGVSGFKKSFIGKKQP